MKTSEIELAIAIYFDPRKNIIVPNISYGMGLHECDLLIVNKDGYATEVEIKISKADLKKDASKSHGHRSNKIKRLYFAMPEDLFTEDLIQLIPERAGIFLIRKKQSYPSYDGVNTYYSGPKVIKYRNPQNNKDAVSLTDKEKANMGRLGMLRYWNLVNK